MSYLLAKDTVNGAEGSVVITRNGRNYVIAGMRNIRPTGNIQSEKMRVIGTRTIQDKPNGVELTGKGNIYYGFDLFRDMVLNYINNGVFGGVRPPDHQQRQGLCHAREPGDGLLRVPSDRRDPPVHPEQRGDHDEL